MTGTVDDRRVSARRSLGRGEPLFPEEPGTLAELFILAERRHGRPDALNSKANGEWQAISNTQLVKRAENIALGLYDLGLRRGDAAAILAPNSPEWTITDAGCQFAGIINVPIYTTLSPASVRYILDDSSTKVLFIDSDASLERISESLTSSSIEYVVLFQGSSAEHPNVITLSELEERGKRTAPSLGRDFVEQLRNSARPQDVATLIYTSGTTGEPKGVMLTHSNIISNVIDAGEKYTFSSADRPLSVLPLSHVFERSAMYLYILNGMAVHYAESIEKVPENLSEVKPTIFVGVPRIFEKVYAKAKLKAAQGGSSKERIFDWAIDVAVKYARGLEESGKVSLSLKLKHRVADTLVFSKLRQFFGGELRSCITGGAALSDDIYLIFTGAGVPIMQGYGLTETSPVITSNNPDAARLGTVGRPIRNMKVRLAADGEIEVSGPGVMLGYYKKDEATREVFTEDGWFRTGDIGTIDNEGFLRITDRKKELFKTSGGKYVAPSPIEQMIRSSRFVSQAVLIGNERRFAAALIVPNFDMLDSYARHKGFDPMSPKEYCSDPRIVDLIERQVAAATEGLAQFETVKRIALLDKELTVETGELTPTMKLKRRVIEAKFSKLIDELYSEASPA